MTTFNILTWILIIGVIVGTVFLVLALTKNNSSGDSSDKALQSKGVLVECKTNFDCAPGLFCDIRSHPTIGVCVVAPGGACHSLGGRNDVCYRGYYCDTQDGTCLKE